MWRICARKRCSLSITRSTTSSKENVLREGISSLAWPSAGLLATEDKGESCENAGREKRIQGRKKNTGQMRIKPFEVRFTVLSHGLSQPFSTAPLSDYQFPWWRFVYQPPIVLHEQFSCSRNRSGR